MAMLERMGALIAHGAGRGEVNRDTLVHAAAFMTAVVIGGSASVGEFADAAKSL